MSLFALTPAAQSRLLTWLAIAAVVGFLAREFIPWPSSPRTTPGEHHISASEGGSTVVYGHAATLRVLGIERPPWSARWPLNLFTGRADGGAVTVEVSEPGGPCLVYRSLDERQIALFPGKTPFLLQFGGMVDRRARFGIEDHLRVHDHAAEINLNQSFPIADTDLTLTVNEIQRASFVPPPGSTVADAESPTVSFTARRKSGASQQFSNQTAGQEVELGEFHIRTVAIRPRQVEFSVHSAGKPGAFVQGKPCSEPEASGDRL